MPKRVVSGIVTSDKMSKTRRVEINRLVKHPKYKNMFDSEPFAMPMTKKMSRVLAIASSY